MKLIDGHRLIKNLRKHHHENISVDGLELLIEQMPAAQPERKTGKWILKPNIYGVAYCSECDYELDTNDTNFCPNCGAYMRGEEE